MIEYTGNIQVHQPDLPPRWISNEEYESHQPPVIGYEFWDRVRAALHIQDEHNPDGEQ